MPAGLCWRKSRGKREENHDKRGGESGNFQVSALQLICPSVLHAPKKKTIMKIFSVANFIFNSDDLILHIFSGLRKNLLDARYLYWLKKSDENE